MAQRITRLTTNQEIAGSNPVWIVHFFVIEQNSKFSKSQKEISQSSRLKGGGRLCPRNLAKSMKSPPGGLEPPTFRLTAERASRLRHGGLIN